MLKVIMSGLLVTSAFAVSISIKKADVTVSLNTQEFTLKKGTTQEIEEGTTVCFVKGEGKVAIEALQKQLKKPGRCLMVPISETTAQSYASSLKKMANVAFWDSSENVRPGTGVKGETEYDSGKSLVLAKDQEFLLIYGKEFGPLPVVVVLKNEQDEEVVRYENNESETTMFHIGRGQLQNGMSLEVYNGFEDLLLKKTISVEEM